MIEEPIPQNRTRKQHEKDAFDLLRRMCDEYVKYNLIPDLRKNIADDIKELLTIVHLEDGYEMLIGNLEKQREKYQEKYLVKQK